MSLLEKSFQPLAGVDLVAHPDCSFLKCYAKLQVDLGFVTTKRVRFLSQHEVQREQVAHP